ncbi:hypothetical protein [Ruegeria lacuscaerulensis]|uniref:hypothetical protein n=1 Tax=Ruegeria lacuscaerulensis TaxID=55218 RepID=UPI001F3F47CF|nr:hypothetical protein [Ruegeria lacuscaerulensis]
MSEAVPAPDANFTGALFTAKALSFAGNVAKAGLDNVKQLLPGRCQDHAAVLA